MQPINGITVRLDIAPIVLAELQDLLDDPDTGAHGWFLGVTRQTTTRSMEALDSVAPLQEKTITERLWYEAHETMARKQLLDLARRAKAKFRLSKVVLVHRLGEVKIGEASVAVGCSSAHRVATFEALPWIMDQLKSEVAIWKQENFADGTTHWVHPTP